MGGRFMLHLYGNGDKPSASTRGNCRTDNFALETQFLGHVDLTQFGNTDGMISDRKLVICQVEAQVIMLLALEMRKTPFLPIFAGMLEFWLRPFLFHEPVVGKGLLKIGKRLFRSAFGDFIDPWE